MKYKHLISAKILLIIERILLLFRHVEHEHQFQTVKGKHRKTAISQVGRNSIFDAGKLLNSLLNVSN